MLFPDLLNKYWLYVQECNIRIELKRKRMEEERRLKAIRLEREQHIKSNYNKYAIDALRYSSITTYNNSEELDWVLLTKIESIGVKDCKTKNSITTITFKDDSSISFWSSNRMYAFGTDIKLHNISCDASLGSKTKISTWLGLYIIENIMHEYYEDE